MFQKIKEFLISLDNIGKENKEGAAPRDHIDPEPQPVKKPTPFWLVFVNTLLPTACAIAYVCIGLFAKIWHPTWLIFFLVPLYYSLYETIEKKNMYYFGFPILAIGVYLLLGFINPAYFATCWVILFSIPLYYLICLAVKKKNVLWFFNCIVPSLCIAGYLLLGFLGGWWHPGWVIFFAVPVYYQTVSAVKKYKAEKKRYDYSESARNDHSRVETMTAEEYEEHRRNK